MNGRFIALILAEEKWLTWSIALGAMAVAILLYRERRGNHSARRRIAAAMSLFFGVTIGTMAFGHLLAVTTKLALGTLEGSLIRFYAIGVVLAVPSWWLIGHSLTRLRGPETSRMTIILNASLVLALLALGLQNIPLAVPALFNIVYQQHSRPVVGWTVLGVAVLVHAGLLIGSLIFLASGQSFEQFRGVQ